LFKLKKIKAFTLSEVLVSIVLMIIVIGIAMSVLNITYQNLNAVKRNISGQSDLEQLELVLSIDSHRFPIIKRTDNKLIFDRGLDSISYRWTEEVMEDKVITHLIRGNDTLINEPLVITTFLYGNAQSKGIIDALKIDLIDSDTAIFIYQSQDAHQNMLEHGF
jgi:competence protein ComGF